MPVAVCLLLFMLVPALVAIVLHHFFRRIVSPGLLLPHHDVAGFLIAVVGVIYAVVLGFVVITVWVNFDSAQRTADLEASDAAEVFSLSNSFPQPNRSELQHAIANYAFEVRDSEWPLLVYGRQDSNARRFYLSALHAITAEATDPRQSIDASLRQYAIEESALSSLHDLSTHRRSRLIDAGNELPGALYLALSVGGLILLAFVFLFGVSSEALQLTMTGLIVASIGLLFGVIIALDRPYTGALRISNEAWTLVIENNHLAEYRSPGVR